MTLQNAKVEKGHKSHKMHSIVFKSQSDELIASPDLFTKFYGTSSNSYLDVIAAKKNVTKGRTYEQTDNPKAFFEFEGIKKLQLCHENFVCQI